MFDVFGRAVRPSGPVFGAVLIGSQDAADLVLIATNGTFWSLGVGDRSQLVRFAVQHGLRVFHCPADLESALNSGRVVGVSEALCCRFCLPYSAPWLSGA